MVDTCSFLRDNPFIKNDTKRLVRRPPIPTKKIVERPRKVVSPAVAVHDNNGVGMRSRLDSHGSSSVTSPTPEDEKEEKIPSYRRWGDTPVYQNMGRTSVPRHLQGSGTNLQDLGSYQQGSSDYVHSPRINQYTSRNHVPGSPESHRSYREVPESYTQGSNSQGPSRYYGPGGSDPWSPVYQNVADCSLLLSRRPLPIHRTDSSLKRRIVRTQSEKRLPLAQEQFLRKIDYEKLQAVLRFMESHQMDPFLDPEEDENPTKAPERPTSLRRAQSERQVMSNVGIDEGRQEAGWKRLRAATQSLVHKGKRRVKFLRSDDIEYGPGIVERLKAKFHRLAGLASKEAMISPHATGKRCPSMDDLVSTSEHDQQTPGETSPFSREHSRSTGDIMLDESEDMRRFTVHRSVKMDDDEEQDTCQSISSLRRKFEQSVQRRPSQNMRHSKVNLISTRPKSTDLSDHHMSSVGMDQTRILYDMPLSPEPLVCRSKSPRTSIDHPLSPRENFYHQVISHEYDRVASPRDHPAKGYHSSTDYPRDLPAKDYDSPRDPTPTWETQRERVTSPQASVISNYQAVPINYQPGHVRTQYSDREVYFGGPTALPFTKEAPTIYSRRTDSKGPAPLPPQESQHFSQFVPPLLSPLSSMPPLSQPSYTPNTVIESPTLKVLEVLNRAGAPRSTPALLHDEEPEFVKVSRRLRPSSVHLSDYKDNITYKDRDDENERHQTVIVPAPSQSFSRMKPEVVFVSAQARVVRETPPDPHPPVRISNTTSSNVEPSPNVFIRTDQPTTQTNYSPPPEEPKPSKVPAPPVPIVDDSLRFRASSIQEETGLTEMQRLLNRFQQSRGDRTFDDVTSLDNHAPILKSETLISKAPAPAPPISTTSEWSSNRSQMSSHTNDQKYEKSSYIPFSQVSSTVTRGNGCVVCASCATCAQTSEGQCDQCSSSSTSSGTVTISIRSGQSKSVIKKVSDEEEPISVISAVSKKTPVTALSGNGLPQSLHGTMATPTTTGQSVHSSVTTPTSTSTTTTTERKSLSAKFMEEKNKQTAPINPLREKPYGDDVMVKTELKEYAIDVIDMERQKREETQRREREENQRYQKEEMLKQERETMERREREETLRREREETMRQEKAETLKREREETQRREREEILRREREETQRREREEMLRREREETLRQEREETQRREAADRDRKQREDDERIEREQTQRKQQEHLIMSFVKDSEGSASSDSELDEPARPISLSLQEPCIAGDGNPVRHSLISLVPAEDIPMLLEAMAERFQFEMMMNDNEPSTSGILRPAEKRGQQTGKIKFSVSQPRVYTYMEEATAIAQPQWPQGSEIDYSAYQKMLAAEQAEYDNLVADLAKWRQNVGNPAPTTQSETVTTETVDVEPVADDLGVTSRFSYPHNEHTVNVAVATN